VVTQTRQNVISSKVLDISPNVFMAASLLSKDQK
jgi:hypothetical protein